MSDNLPADQRIRRHRILEKTRELLARDGYDGINMRDLAVSAEVATTTLYNLYQNKDNLILAALQEVTDNLFLQIESEKLSGIDRYISAREKVANQIASSPNYTLAMTRMLFNAEPADPIVKVVLGQGIKAQKQRLSELVGTGDLPADVDLGFLARSISSSSWSTILLWSKGFVALHDFPDEYVRVGLSILKSTIVPGSHAMEMIEKRLRPG